ncbi:threonine--tRNA ligase [Neisseriaceae bacterium PsAf]|nr:threonine--tRNA ligase [Neisseriaceae bacterium PsAf]MCV2502575.1 threonine--tRNA ligase [Neisseriaceae bacterium]
MPQITLPDGSIKTFDSPVTVRDVAESIGPGLAKATIAGKVNQQLVDISYLIEEDANIEMITSKSEQGLEIIRHSTAHLLAYAVQSLFPDAQVTIGPVIDNGFYYDFAYKRPFTPEDLEKIEAKMHELNKEKHPVERLTMERNEAIEFFLKKGEKYKAEIIESIPENEVLSLYKMGDFIDLCRGPHVPNTIFLKVFKLMKVAGAYWRGDSNNEMLQRIYGTAWAIKEELKEYLFRLEEAEKRDHRKIGKELDLFHLQEEAPGMIFWHAKGWNIWQEIEQYLRKELNLAGYQEVKTPIIMDRSLWERSGHWGNYQENMFITESEKRVYAIKPMNCPAHIEIFKRRIHSYRELPLRISEFGSCHRNEPSGALHGLMRVRGFVQDDAHIFCTEDQIESEVFNFHQLLMKTYKVFGFEDIAVKLSLRPEKRTGNDAIWDKAEEGLRNALTACHINWEELEGEGAFYGPKVEYHIKDSIGRSWQCGTIQLDFVLPARLGAEYVTEHDERATPVMLHRAVIGSFERFIAILIEHYAGQFPLWLSPVQVAILNITENQIDYCCELDKKLQNLGIRTVLDTRNEKIGFKIREQHLQKIPYIVIIGDKERENNTISVRHRSEDLGSMPLDDFVVKLKDEIKNFN